MRGRSSRIVIAAVAVSLLVLPLAQGAVARPAHARAGKHRHAKVPKSTPELLRQAVRDGHLSSDRADLYLARALAKPASVPSQYVSSAPWDGTLALLDLQRVAEQPASEHSTAPQIAQLIGADDAPPATDAPAAASATADVARASARKKHADTCSTSRSKLPKTLTTQHFSINYDPKTIKALNVHAYAQTLETSWRTEITQFGWAAPPSVPNAHHLYHVRIDNLGRGLYGYTAQNGTYAGLVGNNPATSWDDHDAYATCIVLNQDYRHFPSTPINSLRSTAAHEFNHSIQFGMGALTDSNSQIRPDPVFVEGGATWMEDEVFTRSNDNRNYLWPNFGKSMGDYGTYRDDPYAYWIVFRALTEPYGTGVANGGENVMQEFWELTSKRVAGNIGALRMALQDQEGVTMNDAFHNAAIALKFAEGCSGGYVEPTCLKEGPADVAWAGATPTNGSIAGVPDHVVGSIPDDYATNWIRLPASGGPYDVSLHNQGSGGELRSSIVCDDGTSLEETTIPVAGAGQTQAATNFDPTGCQSVMLVITNQANTQDNPANSTSRAYRVDVS